MQPVAVIQDNGPAIITHGGAEKYSAGVYGQHFLASPAADIYSGVATAAAAFPEVGKNLTSWNGPGPGQGFELPGRKSSGRRTIRQAC